MGNLKPVSCRDAGRRRRWFRSWSGMSSAMGNLADVLREAHQIGRESKVGFVCLSISIFRNKVD